MLRYLRHLSAPRFVLWCYFIWWVGVAIPYFDPNPRLWLSAIGISIIIGTGLLLSTVYGSPTPAVLGRWVIARLFMMPFFVSSFAALIKDRGFFVVFHPDWTGNLRPLLGCAALSLLVLGARSSRLFRSDRLGPS